MAVARAASVLGSFPFRAALVALCVLLLPLLPSPQGGGEDGGGGGGGHAFLAKVWELLHLLLVGIAVSYGLFGRRNDGGLVGAAGEKDDGGAAPAMGKTTDARYVSRMLQGDLVFDDDDGGARSWSALHHAEEPAVMVADGGGGRSGHVARQQAPQLSLPVRALRPQQGSVSGDGEPRAPRRSAAHDDTRVLPSPIPWRSRTGRLGGDAPSSNTSSPAPSPKRLSPAPSMSKEAAAEEHEAPRRRSTYRSSQPPPPPPPPPPFLVHGYHPVAERRTTTAAAAAKSFKEELQHHSTRGRGDRDRYSQSSHSLSNSSSSANPRSSFDGPSSPSIGRSVRTIRPRQGIQTQTQIQELPNDDDGGGSDAPDNSRGSGEEPYGYRAYQSIPRFEYEKGDPILGKVTVSSESSDDDDEGDEAYSTRATNSPSTAAAVDENEVDKKAEEFIARFREQIRLQRIESIKKSAGPRAVKHGK